MSDNDFNEGDDVEVLFSSGWVRAVYWQRSIYPNFDGIYEHIVKPVDEPNMRYFGQFTDDRIRQLAKEVQETTNDKYQGYEGGKEQHDIDLDILKPVNPHLNVTFTGHPIGNVEVVSDALAYYAWASRRRIRWLEKRLKGVEKNNNG